MLKFGEIVTPDIARYALPFRVYEDERKQVLYYLVHLTNNDLGMREMKEAMVEQEGGMTFWPVTTRPPDQLALEVEESAPYPSLQRRIREKYRGQTLKFRELLNDDYPNATWVEKQYREALRTMTKASPPEVRITRNRKTRSGRQATRGIKLEDALTFANPD